MTQSSTSSLIGRRVGFAVVVSFIGRVVSSFAGLVTLPYLSRHLGSEEFGLWALLLQSAPIVLLLDLGISATLTRHIALAVGKERLTVESSGRFGDSVSSLARVGQWLGCIVAPLAFLVAGVVGTFVTQKHALNPEDAHRITVAWWVLSASQAINVGASPWSALLAGLGHVGWDQVAAASIVFFTAVAQILAIRMGGGIVGISVATALANILVRTVFILAVSRVAKRTLTADAPPDWAVLHKLTRQALRSWVTDLGAFMILRTHQFFLASFVNRATVGKYLAITQLLQVPTLVAVSAVAPCAVFVGHLWTSGDYRGVQRIVLSNLRVAMAVLFFGTGCLLACAQEVISLWLGPTMFIGYDVVLCLCILTTLEFQHVICASLSRATEDEVYAAWAIGAGILNLTFGWFLVPRFGALGMAAGTMTAQLLTNNWFAVWHPLKRLRVSVSSYLREVFLPLLLATALLLLCLLSSKPFLLPRIGPFAWATLATTTFATAGILWLWAKVLEEDSKRRIFSRFPVFRTLENRKES